jgi:hypothetical protein
LTSGPPAQGALDRLVLHQVITGYTVESDVSYLAAARPTLTYRVYDDGPGCRHLGHFLSDVRRLGARVCVCPATGNLQDLGAEGGIRRTRQLTATTRFTGHDALEAAIELVRTRYQAGRPGAVDGSWRRPDVRVTGALPGGGMARVTAHWARLDTGGAVTLTLDGRSLLPGLVQVPVWVLEDWLPFLAGCEPCEALAEAAG